MTVRRIIALLAAAALAACEPRTIAPLTPLPPITGDAGQAAARINGAVGRPAADAQAQSSLAAAPSVFLRPPPNAGAGGGGSISLNFADTDIRDVVAQILGATLGQSYTIDPGVHGTVTLRTAQPLGRDQLLPVLQTLLAQNGAALVQAGGVYRVLPTAAAGATGGLASGDNSGGAQLIPLRYASAEDLAKVLQPFVQNGGRIVADAGANALIVTGDPTTRQTLTGLIGAFDVNVLAGQSYALLPVTAGDAKDFASALQDALRGSGGALSSVVKVIPMARIGAVLVVSSQPRFIEETRRVYALVDRKRRQTVRSWRVYYLQNSKSDDIAYVLQQAFTPNNVTATPPAQNHTLPAGGGLSQGGGLGSGQVGGGIGGGGLGGGGLGGGLPGASLGGGGIGSGLGSSATIATPLPANSPPPAPPASGNPLLGGLEPGDNGAGGGANADQMRIIPNSQNNALLIYGTPEENDTVEAMLHKLDIVPLQVRIDAAIAEVTLNDTLRYGTQFFFKAGLQGALSFGTSAAAFASGFPGFVLSGPNNTSAALDLLQSITKVKMLSSPQLLVQDNQPARLMVGALVPYLSQSSQSTLTSNAPIVNSINYQQTGVILQVTPRVNAGGLVTLDISQEVSDVATGVTTPGVTSPTFNERSVASRVVIQDGQTVGLAGLITDSDSRQNQGIPWLKDIPLLGVLAGSQSNDRTRTELLVLITPHVVHDQRDARQLTEDLRDQLNGAAAVPQQLQNLGPSGSADPDAEVRRRLGLQR